MEVHINMPEGRRAWDRAMEDLGAYFVGALKGRNVEVCERKLGEADRERFREAKAVEVKNFVASEAFEVLPQHLQQQGPSHRHALDPHLEGEG